MCSVLYFWYIFMINVLYVEFQWVSYYIIERGDISRDALLAQFWCMGLAAFFLQSQKIWRMHIYTSQIDA